MTAISGVPGAETPGQPALRWVCANQGCHNGGSQLYCGDTCGDTCGYCHQRGKRLPSCPTHAVCPPCREGWGHWTGSEYVPTLESVAARSGRPVAYTEKGERR